LFGIRSRDEFKKAYQGWVAEVLDKETYREREGRWTESIAVGNESFIRDVKEKLGLKAMWREIAGANGSYELRELTAVYDLVFDAQNRDLRQKNALFLDLFT
jgi:putative transposase